jgi:hypothetical protein
MLLPPSWSPGTAAITATSFGSTIPPACTRRKPRRRCRAPSLEPFDGQRYPGSVLLWTCHALDGPRVPSWVPRVPPTGPSRDRGTRRHASRARRSPARRRPAVPVRPSLPALMIVRLAVTLRRYVSCAPFGLRKVSLVRAAADVRDLHALLPQPCRWDRRVRHAPRGEAVTGSHVVSGIQVAWLVRRSWAVRPASSKARTRSSRPSVKWVQPS